MTPNVDFLSLKKLDIQILFYKHKLNPKINNENIFKEFDY